MLMGIATRYRQVVQLGPCWPMGLASITLPGTCTACMGMQQAVAVLRQQHHHIAGQAALALLTSGQNTSLAA
jgi:hypothetical protein